MKFISTSLVLWKKSLANSLQPTLLDEPLSADFALTDKDGPRASALADDAIAGENVVSGWKSAIADVEAGWVLCQQCRGLLSVAASSNRTAASCISELTLPTHFCH